MASDSDLPDYYRHLANDEESEDAPPEQQPAGARADQTSEESAAPQQPAPPNEHFRADAFRMKRPAGEADWTDRTTYTITGPTTGGIQHNITVTVEHEPEADTLDAFAEAQVATLEPVLDDCRVLLEDRIALANERPARRAIFVWRPEDDLKLYQEQLYVLHGGRGYTLTASFTRETRKTLGPDVERMMRSFQPGRAATET